jgi:ABC-type dipeptide/oligopeptide/nickel transport system permease component
MRLLLFFSVLVVLVCLGVLVGVIAASKRDESRDDDRHDPMRRFRR